MVSFWMALYTVFVVTRENPTWGNKDMMMSPDQYQEIVSKDFKKYGEKGELIITYVPQYKMQAPLWVVYYVKECNNGFVKEEFGKYPTQKQAYELNECTYKKWRNGDRTQFTDPDFAYGVRFPNEEIIIDNGNPTGIDSGSLNFR